MKSLPLFLSGVVCKGFGRGSKQLGIPTANFGDEVVKSLPDDLPCGPYYGWAQVDSSPVYKMATCIGWNPFYKNEKRSAETHIIHEFSGDFYGSELKIIVLGFIRPEKDFLSVDELISAIKSDVAVAESKLEEECNLQYKSHPFFSKHKNLTEPRLNGVATDEFERIY